MNLKEYLILITLVVLICGILCFLIYKNLNEKIVFLLNEVNELKNGAKSRTTEEFRSQQNNKSQNIDSCPIPSRTNVYYSSSTNIQSDNNRTNQNIEENKEIELEDKESNNSSIERVEDEVERLENELENIENMIESSDEEQEYEDEEYDEQDEEICVGELIEEDENNESDINLGEKIEFEPKLVESTNESLDNNLVNLVNQFENKEHINIDESRKNNSSEFDELANIESDRNSELNDLIKKEMDINGNIIDNIEKNETKSLNSVKERETNDSNSIREDFSNDSKSINNLSQFEDCKLIAKNKKLLQKDLKDICKHLNIPQKGNKLHLVEKIFEAGGKELINSKINA